MGRTVKRTWLAGGLGGLLLLGVAGVAGGEEKFKYQYEFGSIRIPRADAGEPKRREVSVQRAWTISTREPLPGVAAGNA